MVNFSGSSELLTMGENIDSGHDSDHIQFRYPTQISRVLIQHFGRIFHKH